MKNWFAKNYKTFIIISFLVPIVTVAVVSISHVTTWYGISNPLTWATYLSVGIEIAALSALAAISANMGSKVYFPFIIVTIIQFIGNIFFAYSFIDTDSKLFKDWVDLVSPLVEYIGVESGDVIGHKRFFSFLSGGMLPIISLSFLHMLVKFTEGDKKKENGNELTKNDVSHPENQVQPDVVDTKDDNKEEETKNEEPIQASDIISEVSRIRPTEEMLNDIESHLSKLEIKNKEEVLKDEDTPITEGELILDPPTWVTEVPQPSQDDLTNWDVTLDDGLDDEPFEETKEPEGTEVDVILPEENINEEQEEVKEEIPQQEEVVNETPISVEEKTIDIKQVVFEKTEEKTPSQEPEKKNL